MSKERVWTVFPEDEDEMPQDFETYEEAKEYAEGKPSVRRGYVIEQSI